MTNYGACESRPDSFAAVSSIRPIGPLVERIEQIEKVVGEIERFAEYAEKVAQSGWRPDLNDGLILCAAPLEPLFADDAWRERVAQYRKDLEKKKYSWATVQREFFGSGL